MTSSPARITAALKRVYRAATALAAEELQDAVDALLIEADEEPMALLAAAQALLIHRSAPERATELLEKARASAPEAEAGFALEHMILVVQGEAERATELAEERIRRFPDSPRPYFDLASSAPKRAIPYRDAMEALAVSPAVDEAGRAELMNALGRVYEAADNRPAAFNAYLVAKRLQNRPYDATAVAQRLKDARNLFTREHFTRFADAGSDDERMIFVVGLPRSGSTLTERILCAHPEVAAAGETPEIRGALDQFFGLPGPSGEPRYNSPRTFIAKVAENGRAAAARYLERVALRVDQPDAARWIDKMPGNILNVGEIATLFPKARFVITDRDPRDVMLSCLRVLFAGGQPFTADMGRFIHYWLTQRELAAHWRSVLGDRVLEMRYESLACDPETETRRLIAHAGLEWRADCAEPENTEGPVTTASALQVRQPIHTRSIGGWKEFDFAFGDLTRVIEQYETLRAAA